MCKRRQQVIILKMIVEMFKQSPFSYKGQHMCFYIKILAMSLIEEIFESP